MTLLDIGCGWGALVKRAVEKYDVNVIGLTLSRNQYDRGRALVADLPTERNVDIRLQGWEEFDEPVDRIVSIGAFEHFRRQRYSAFFSKCRSVLQPGGRMLLHTIVITPPDPASGAGGLTREDAHFSRFILRDIFPGGQLTLVKVVKAKAAEAGFELLREHALGPHYARTLDTWAEKLIASKDEAIALSSEATYDKYVQYLTGSSERFKNSRINVVQFTLEAEDTPAE